MLLWRVPPNISPISIIYKLEQSEDISLENIPMEQKTIKRINIHTFSQFGIPSLYMVNFWSIELLLLLSRILWALIHEIVKEVLLFRVIIYDNRITSNSGLFVISILQITQDLVCS
jgi:hypothetical protein